MFIFIAEHKEYEIGSEIYVVCTLTLSGPSLRLRQARGPSAPHVLHLIPHQLPAYESIPDIFFLGLQNSIPLSVLEFSWALRTT